MQSTKHSKNQENTATQATAGGGESAPFHRAVAVGKEEKEGGARV